MKKTYPIHDLFIRNLEASEVEGRITLPLLSFEDHLLRRFGFAESITFGPKYQNGLKVRAVADEIWTCTKGSVLFHWQDLRKGSPTFNLHHELIIKEPTLVLVPFGVGFGVQTYDEAVHVIRFSTHPAHVREGDYEVPWERD